MAVRVAWCGLALVAALILGVSGAVGRGFATTTTVRFQIEGVGEVTDDKNQLDCGNGHTNCRVSYTGTGTVTFSATAGQNWQFVGWDGDDCDSDCQVPLDLSDDEHQEIASFTSTQGAPGQFTLTVTNNGDANDNGGNVGASLSQFNDIDCDTGDNPDAGCQTTVDSGSTLTLLETPDQGFIFSGWGGPCSGTAKFCTVVMNQNRSVTASFKKPRLTVNLQGNGTVTGAGIACTPGSGSGCAADENAGEAVTLTATAPSGGSFTSWQGACSGSNTTCTVTMDADKSVTANFSGGSVQPTTFPLSVSVTGDGRVTGGAINCGGGGTACSANVSSGTSVTLTATPVGDANFTSWGGACSGSSQTCTVTMNQARSVTATFSGGSTATVALSVTSTGRGMVTGGGISCGNGKTVCTAKVTQDSTIGLTAAAARGARFSGWGGACSGTKPTCTLQMDEAKEVSASFTGGGGTVGPGGGGGPSGLHRLGPAHVGRTANGFQVTLRFHSSSRGRARMQALRAGRVQTSLAFSAAAGDAVVGPFPVAKPGFYTFELHVGRQTLRWTACLGRCGERASSSPFTLTRGRAGAVDAGALWSVTLHFGSSQPAGAVVNVYRAKKLARTLRFPIPAGRYSPDALLLSPGTYRIRLTATDAVGRVRTLSWYALLPANL
jgi:hypothetical protein